MSKDTILNRSKRSFVLAFPIGILAAVFMKFFGGRVFDVSSDVTAEIQQYVSSLPEDSIYTPDPKRYSNL